VIPVACDKPDPIAVNGRVLTGAGPHQPPPAFELRRSVRDGETWVELAGELDMASAPDLSDALAAVQTGPVVVDLSRLEFIDCTGIRALVAASDELGARLRIVPGDDRVQRVFRVLDLEDVLPFEARTATR
jgi:anti-anti-sigma factor